MPSPSSSTSTSPACGPTAGSHGAACSTSKRSWPARSSSRRSRCWSPRRWVSAPESTCPSTPHRGRARWALKPIIEILAFIPSVVLGDRGAAPGRIIGQRRGLGPLRPLSLRRRHFFPSRWLEGGDRAQLPPPLSFPPGQARRSHHQRVAARSPVQPAVRQCADLHCLRGLRRTTRERRGERAGPQSSRHATRRAVGRRLSGVSASGAVRPALGPQLGSLRYLSQAPGTRPGDDPARRAAQTAGDAAQGAGARAAKRGRRRRSAASTASIPARVRSSARPSTRAPTSARSWRCSGRTARY